MEVLLTITAKDIFLVVILGGIISYIIGRIVNAQTVKKKLLGVELIGREIKLEKGTYYPYTMTDNETGEVLENCYCIYTRIWNKGNLEIKDSDIDPKNPLIIYLDSTAELSDILNFLLKINMLISKLIKLNLIIIKYILTA